jgi:hypothetical protein
MKLENMICKSAGAANYAKGDMYIPFCPHKTEYTVIQCAYFGREIHIDKTYACHGKNISYPIQMQILDLK